MEVFGTFYMVSTVTILKSVNLVKKIGLKFSGSSKEKRLNWDDRIQIALGTAHGLAYLHHECNPRIIHRDVKSSNILLDRDYVAHLTDFGIAKSLSGSRIDTSTYIMGTIGYIDPEYARTFRVNEKSDVYSYGIVFLELLTGRKAVVNESNLHQWVNKINACQMNPISS